MSFDLVNAAYDSVSLDVSGQDVDPRAVTFNNDGTKVYIAGDSSNAIYEYDLSTPWDLDTATYNSVSLDVSTETTSPAGIRFNSDGTLLIVLSQADETFYEYSLTSAFDLSTASVTVNTLDISEDVNTPRDFTFSPDGTVLAVTNLGGDLIINYSLSSAFDITTATLASQQFATSSQETNPFGAAFNDDGSKLFALGADSDTVFEYDLSAAFDVSTAVYNSVSFSVASEAGSPFGGFVFGNSGEKMYVLDDGTTNLYQYSTVTPPKLSGTFNVSMGLSGTLSNTTKRLSGTLEPSLDLQGAMRNTIKRLSGTLSVSVGAQGEVGLFRGEFLLNQTLPELELDANIDSGRSMFLDASLPELTMSAFIGGPNEAVLPIMTMSATLLNGQLSTLNRSLPELELSATMTADKEFTLNKALPELQMQATLANGRLLRLESGLPALTLEAALKSGQALQLNQDLPELTLEAQIAQDNDFALNASLPVLGIVAAMAAPDASDFTVYTMNTETFRFSEFRSYDYDYLLKWQGGFYGVKDDGIYLLAGDTDPDGDKPDWSIKFGFFDFNEEYVHRIDYIYGGYKRTGEGDILVTAKPEAEHRPTREYLLTRERPDAEGQINRGRAKTAAGIKSVYWQTGIKSDDGVDVEVDYISMLYRTLKRKT